MDARRAGFVVLSIALVLLGALWATQPLPKSPYEMVADGGGRAVVRAADLVHYDAANDTTLAVFGTCDHQPCGDAYSFRGDATRELREPGPRLLVPEGPPRRERADVSLNERMGTPAPYGDPSRAAGAHTVVPPMRLEPMEPLLAAWVVPALAAFVGASLAAGARWSALGPVLAGGAGLGLASVNLVLVVLATPFVLVGTLLGAALALLRGRRRGLAAALVLSLAAFLALAWLGDAFFPPMGGEV